MYTFTRILCKPILGQDSVSTSAVSRHTRGYEGDTAREKKILKIPIDNLNTFKN